MQRSDALGSGITDSPIVVTNATGSGVIGITQAMSMPSAA